MGQTGWPNAVGVASRGNLLYSRQQGFGDAPALPCYMHDLKRSALAAQVGSHHVRVVRHNVPYGMVLTLSSSSAPVRTGSRLVYYFTVLSSLARRRNLNPIRVPSAFVPFRSLNRISWDM